MAGLCKRMQDCKLMSAPCTGLPIFFDPRGETAGTPEFRRRAEDLYNRLHNCVSERRLANGLGLILSI